MGVEMLSEEARAMIRTRPRSGRADASERTWIDPQSPTQHDQRAHEASQHRSADARGQHPCHQDKDELLPSRRGVPLAERVEVPEIRIVALEEHASGDGDVPTGRGGGIESVKGGVGGKGEGVVRDSMRHGKSEEEGQDGCEEGDCERLEL